MRVPAVELAVDGIHHVGEGERALLLGHPGVEHHLEQQIAELVLEVAQVATLDRIHDLVGFLDRIGRDGRETLLQVPGAAGVRRSQGRHDVEQSLDVSSRTHRIGRVVRLLGHRLGSGDSRRIPHDDAAPPLS
jgi:hypothetical protein